jgi:hypothetical protein
MKTKLEMPSSLQPQRKGDPVDLRCQCCGEGPVQLYEHEGRDGWAYLECPSCCIVYPVPGYVL